MPQQRGRPRSPGRSGAAWRKVSALVRARDTHCWLCLRALTTRAWPHPLSTSVHHVIPLALDGPALDPRNLVATHLRCNEEAGSRVLGHGALGHGALAERTTSARADLNPSREW